MVALVMTDALIWLPALFCHLITDTFYFSVHTQILKPHILVTTLSLQCISLARAKPYM